MMILLIEKNHSKLLRNIRTYCDYLTEAKVGLSEFFNKLMDEMERGAYHDI